MKTLFAIPVALCLAGCGASNAQRQQLTEAHDRYVDAIMVEVHTGHMTKDQAADAVREWNDEHPGSRAQATGTPRWVLLAQAIAIGAGSAPTFHPNYSSPAYSPAAYTPPPVAMTSPSLYGDAGYLHNQPAPQTRFIPFSGVSQFEPGMNPDGTTKE